MKRYRQSLKNSGGFPSDPCPTTWKVQPATKHPSPACRPLRHVTAAGTHGTSPFTGWAHESGSAGFAQHRLDAPYLLRQTIGTFHEALHG